MSSIVFPTLKDKKMVQVNLAEEAKKRDNAETANPYFSIEEQETLLEQVKIKYNADVTYGGYGEDRSDLWRNFEVSSRSMIHLGVDVNNLQPKTPICCPVDCEVIHVMQDDTKLNGWGGRVIFRLQKPFLECDYLLVGHLQDLPMCGQKFAAGDYFAQVALSEINGGWFAHVHFQLIKQSMMKVYENNLCLLDGYLLDKDIQNGVSLSEWSADPTSLLFRENVQQNFNA